MDKETLTQQLKEILTKACVKHGGRADYRDVWVWENDRHPEDWSASLQREYSLAFHPASELVRKQLLDDFHAALLELYPRFKEPYGIGGPTTALHPHRYLSFLVRASYKETPRSFKFDATTIRSAIKKFWKIIEMEQVRTTFIVTLEHFFPESQTIRLPEGLSIRRITKDEIKELYAAEDTDERKVLCAYAIAGKFQRRMLFGAAAERARTSPEDFVREFLCEPVLKALWLIGRGRLRFGDILFREATPSFYGLVHGGTITERDSARFVDYRLSKADEPRFRTLLAALQRKRSANAASRRIDAAIDRLSHARTGLEDRYRLLDAVTALEIMLLPGKEGPVKMRFHLHYASLGKDAEQRHLRRKRAAELYELRSSITHGDALSELTFEGRPTSLRAVADLAAEMAGELIERAYLDSSFDFTSQDWWYRQLLG